MSAEESLLFFDQSERQKIKQNAEWLVDKVADWTENNIARPALNAAYVTPRNALSNVLGEKILSHTEEFEVKAPTGFGSEFAQSASGAVGGILPYVIAGKLTGGLLRTVGANIMTDAIVSRICRHEITGMVAGAGLYDLARDVRPGETRLGNMTGGMAAFGAFGLSKYLTAEMAFGQKLLAQAGIGGLAGEAQLIASKKISGGLIDDRDLRQAAYHGAITNLILPTVQHKVDAAVNKFSAGASRIAELFTGGRESTSLERGAAGNPRAVPGSVDRLQFGEPIMKDISITHGAGGVWKPVKDTPISMRHNSVEPGQRPITDDPIYCQMRDRAAKVYESLDLITPVGHEQLADGTLVIKYKDGVTVKDIANDKGDIVREITTKDGVVITDRESGGESARRKTVFPDGSEFESMSHGVVLYKNVRPQTDGSVQIDRLGPFGREAITIKDGIKTVIQDDGAAYRTWQDSQGRYIRSESIDSVLNDGTVQRYPKSGPYHFESIAPDGSHTVYHREGNIVIERRNADGTLNQTYRDGLLEQQFVATDGKVFAFHKGGTALGFQIGDGTHVIMPTRPKFFIFDGHDHGPQLALRINNRGDVIAPKTTVETANGTVNQVYEDGVKISTKKDGNHVAEMADGSQVHGNGDTHVMMAIAKDGKSYRIQRDVSDHNNLAIQKPVFDSFRFEETGTTIRESTADGTLALAVGDGTEFRYREAPHHLRAAFLGTPEAQGARYDTNGKLVKPQSVDVLHNGDRKLTYADHTVLLVEQNGKQTIYSPSGREVTLHRSPFGATVFETTMPDGQRFLSHKVLNAGPNGADRWTQTSEVYRQDQLADGTIRDVHKLTLETSFTLPDGTTMRCAPSGTLLEADTKRLNYLHRREALEHDPNVGPNLFAEPGGSTSFRPSETPLMAHHVRQAHRYDSSGKKMEPNIRHSGTDVIFRYDDGVIIRNEGATGNQITTMPDRSQYIWTNDSVFIHVKPDGSRFMHYPDGSTVDIAIDGTTAWSS
jgi:hypothetical protein